MERDYVGANVKVFLESDQEWVEGIVEKYHTRKGYHVQFFDGQDKWLDSLDSENVEVEGGLLDDTRRTDNFDELEVINPNPENPEDDDMVEIENMTVPDFQRHQEANQLTLRADLVTLPARGVMLVGSVLGAAGLEDPAGLGEGDVSFRVLFVEGGSQPAMFRCKTPIYSSDSVACSSHPSWSDAQFHFDMIMAQGPGDAGQEFGFRLQGEIIVAVYQARASGGNTLLGQVAFDLKDIVGEGTVEFFSAGCEGRSITGAQTLKSRGGAVCGELDVQLNVGWRSLKPPANPRRSQSQELNMTAPGGAGVGGSASAGRLNKSTSAAAGTGAGVRRPSSAAGRTGTTGTRTAGASTGAGAGAGAGVGAGASAGAGVRPAATRRPASASAPRTIVSGLLRKQREDRARIERDNMKLQKTLQARGGKIAPGGYGAIVPEASRAASGMGVGSGARAASLAADPKSRANGREDKSHGMGAKDGGGASYEQLLKIYTELKRASGLDEQANARLRLRVGKLKVSVRQAEVSVEKSGGAKHSQGRGGSVGGGGARMASNLGRDLLRADAKDAHGDSLRSYDSKQGGTGGAGGGAWGVGPMTAAELAALQVQDGEYSSLAEEYAVLQNVRRGLLERVALAKAAGQRASSEQLSAHQRLLLLQRRVSYFQEVAGRLALDVDLHHLGPTMPKSMPKPDTGARGAGSKAGPGQGPEQGQGGAGQEQEATDRDFRLFDELRENQAGCAAEQALLTAGAHSYAQESALHELEAVASLLRDRVQTAEANNATLRAQTGALQRQLRESMGGKAFAMREFIIQMRGRLGTRRLHSRLRPSEQGLLTMEEEIARLRQRAKPPA